MLRWHMGRGIAAFERQWNYDAGYVHEMIGASPRAAWMCDGWVGRRRERTASVDRSRPSSSSTAPPPAGGSGRKPGFLTDDGHTVYRATLTGLGERMHLNSPDIDLQTHINDVVNLILFEDFTTSCSPATATAAWSSPG
jgi:hypothetical protein